MASVEIGEQRVKEDELGVGGLPDQEVRRPLLAGGPDEQVDVGNSRLVEITGEHVLVDPVGIKVSDRETQDILDVFNTSPPEVERRSWHDPAAWAPDLDALSDDELVIRARNWEALCLYGWNPYMYNPQLKRWLRRITVPTLVLWGASDGIVKPSYGRVYSALIPQSRFELIERAGHHPEIEQARAFVDAVVKFLNR